MTGWVYDQSNWEVWPVTVSEVVSMLIRIADQYMPQ